MTDAMDQPYVIRPFINVMDLVGIPNEVMAHHLSLYGSYVNGANDLLNLRRARSEYGDAARPLNPVQSAAELRLPHLINGIRLHELYFEQFVSGGTPYDHEYGWGPYLDQLYALYMIGGPGWAVLGQPQYGQGQLMTYRVQGHADGNLAGYEPILVIDTWEHAYEWTTKELAWDAVMANIDWNVVASRL